MDEADGLSDERMREAIEALLTPERFREAELRVAKAAPQLQKVLSSALAEGGWFDASHEQHVRNMAATPDLEERLTALRTLLAEEVRLGMMVGVAIGWELARELEAGEQPSR